jgi:YHS domain-containing protein
VSRRLRLSARTIRATIVVQQGDILMKKNLPSIAVLGLTLFLLAALGFAGDEKKTQWKGDIYTLETCPVSGAKLGSMGTPVVKNYDGREIRFCCDSCPERFEVDKARYLKKVDDQLTEKQMAHYPLTHCVVMADDELKPNDEGGPVNLVYNNRLVRFCCPHCQEDFKKEPAKFVAKLNEAVIAQQKDKYPLTTCPVSGEKLGSMGEPVNYVVGTTLVRFCCDSCVKDFEKNPQPVLAKVHEGWKKAHSTDDDHSKGG